LSHKTLHWNTERGKDHYDFIKTTSRGSVYRVWPFRLVMRLILVELLMQSQITQQYTTVYLATLVI